MNVCFHLIVLCTHTQTFIHAMKWVVGSGNGIHFRCVCVGGGGGGGSQYMAANVIRSAGKCSHGTLGGLVAVLIARGI